MTRPYKGKRRTNKKKHKRGRGRSQRGGSPIRYTKCGPACPYFSRTPQYSGGGKKLTRHRRRRSQRGGSPIRYTKCGPACPYFSRTPQYSGGGRKSRRRNQKRRRIRRRTRRRRRRRGGAPSPLWVAAVAAVEAKNYNTLKEKAWKMVKAQLETNPKLKELVDGGCASIGAEAWKEVNIVPDPEQVLPPGLFYSPDTIKIISGAGRAKFIEDVKKIAKVVPAVKAAIPAGTDGADQFLNKLIVIILCHELVHWFQDAAPCTGVKNLEELIGKAAALGDAQNHCWKESFATAIATQIAVNNEQGQVEVAGRLLLEWAQKQALAGNPSALSAVKLFYNECYFKPLSSYNCSGQANFNITADQYEKYLTARPGAPGGAGAPGGGGGGGSY